MALSDSAKRTLEQACGVYGMGTEIATALDANTLKTSYTSSHNTFLNAVTASAAELNLADGAVAGTAVASKLACLGEYKDIEALRLNESAYIESLATDTLASATADAYAGGVVCSPYYAGSNLTRHNYVDLVTPTTSGMNITTSCVLRFDGDTGTHPATTATATTSPAGAFYININGAVKRVRYHD